MFERSALQTRHSQFRWWPKRDLPKKGFGSGIRANRAIYHLSRNCHGLNSFEFLRCKNYFTAPEMNSPKALTRQKLRCRNHSKPPARTTAPKTNNIRCCNAIVLGQMVTKKPLTRVSKRVPGAHGKRGLERGWQKGLAKGWRRAGEGLAKGWRRVSGFPCTLQFRNSRGARLETLVCDFMV